MEKASVNKRTASLSLILCALAIIFSVFVLPKNVSAAAKIGKKAAIKVALKDVGKKQSSVKKLTCKFERADDAGEKDVYEVEFRAGKYSYEYNIDPYKGIIRESEKERIKDDKSTGKKKLTSTKAYKIALKDAKTKKAKVSALKVREKKSKKYIYYKVTFRKGKYRYEYEINAYTGTINEREVKL